TSTVDLIAIALRNAIFSGALEVGTPIREIEMAAQLGASRSPLREAMQRLVQERLLSAVHERGLRVSTITADHVADVYHARPAGEGKALRLVASDRDTQVLAQLGEAYRGLFEARSPSDARAIGDAGINFPPRLVNLAGSRRLSDYLSS